MVSEKILFETTFRDAPQLIGEYDGDIFIRSQGMKYFQTSDNANLFRALLAERARRDEVFARLKEYVTNTGYYDKEYIDALQAEWDAPGETERGEGR